MDATKILCRNIVYSRDPFSEIDPDIEKAEGDHKNDHILLNNDEYIKKPSENHGDLLVSEEEAGDGQSLEEIDEAADDQEVYPDSLQKF